MKPKSITTIIFGIIGIVFIAIAVYGAVVKKGDSESKKYKDWTPYENLEAGFSLMRPKSFVVYEDKIEHPDENEYPKEIIFASKPRPERPGMFLETYVDRTGYAVIIGSGENATHLTPEEWIKRYLHPVVLENLLEQKKKQIEIAGHKAFMVEPKTGEVSTLKVILVTQNEYFSIRLMPHIPKRDKDAIRTLNLILESFKLIEKSK